MYPTCSEWPGPFWPEWPCSGRRSSAAPIFARSTYWPNRASALAIRNSTDEFSQPYALVALAKDLEDVVASQLATPFATGLGLRDPVNLGKVRPHRDDLHNGKREPPIGNAIFVKGES